MTCTHVDAFAKHDIGRVVFAACMNKREDTVEEILSLCESHGMQCDLNASFLMVGGPSLFGEEKHYSEGNVTPLLALVMSTLTAASADTEDTKLTACFELLLRHSANPYKTCQLTENRFPFQVLRMNVDIRGLLRLSQMFDVGSSRVAQQLETILDTFEMKMGLQELLV